MITLFLAVAAAQPLGMTQGVIERTTAIRLYLEYAHCMEVETTIRGAFTNEAPRDVVVSVRRKCSGRWRKLQAAVIGREPTASNLQLLSNLANLAEGNAASSLVVTRKGSCGTAAGPYQCRP